MRSLPTCALVYCLVFCCGTRACADLIFDGFESIDDLQLNGVTTTVTTGDGVVLRLTPAQFGQAGTVFSTAKVSTEKFLTAFSFRIHGNGGITDSLNTTSGADGIAFVVQNVANNVGGEGGGIGYQGLAPSIGVEFDTWHNLELNEPSASHVGIDLNGSVLHGISNGPTANVSSPSLDEGQRWWSWVIYENQQIDVYLLASESVTEPARPSVPLISYALDLGFILGEETAFAGFTSGTGSAWANHDILYWRYTNTIPEPSSLVLLVSALTTTSAVACRKRKWGGLK